MVYIHTMKYYSALKKGKFFICYNMAEPGYKLSHKDKDFMILLT